MLVPELQQSFSELNIGSIDSKEESEAECPECGLDYGSAQDEEQWVQCDNCAAWWDMTCAGIDENIADLCLSILLVCRSIITICCVVNYTMYCVTKVLLRYLWLIIGKFVTN